MLGKIATQSVFCAIKDAEIVGTVALDADYVVGFYTRLQHLNKGIGKMLMNYLEEYAREQGISTLQLAASPVGVAFYFKTRWQKVKVILPEYYGVVFEETLMIKTL